MEKLLSAISDESTEKWSFQNNNIHLIATPDEYFL